MQMLVRYRLSCHRVVCLWIRYVGINFLALTEIDGPLLAHVEKLCF